MVKHLLFFTIVLIFFQISEVYSQITIGTVDAGPYTPGSSIAATFTMESICIRPGNNFELYLVRPDGTEIPGSIGFYSGFYSTFVNGTIPAGTPAGTGYRLRVKATNPVFSSDASTSFEIKSGSVADPILNSESKISESPRTFGLCEADDNTPNEFEFINESNTGNVVVTIKNTLTPATTTTLTYNTNGPDSYKSFTAEKTHYTLLAKATMPDGSIGTKAYFLINNPVITAFQTIGGITVCYPTGKFEYQVGENIKLNFPGNIYKIDWGDDTAPSEYTYCDIVESNFNVSHLFTRSSCGLSYTSGNQTFYNAFAVNVGVISPFCDAIGRPLSSPARVITRPINSFERPEVACLGAVTFTNTSVAGQTPRPNSTGCDPSTMRYIWYVDGVEVGRSFNLTYDFTTTGTKTIRLESTSVGGTCQAEAVERTICIQNPPKPDFILTANKICLTPGTVNPENTSLLDNTCPKAAPIYTWNVTGPSTVAYLNGTNANSEDPQFKFNQIGRYSISLTIQTGTCEVTSTIQEVIVDGEPTAELSDEAKICQRGPLTFDPTATITKTIITGSVDNPSPQTDTYTWEVLGPGAYNFVGPSNANSKYPTINFSDYGTYTVKLTFKNSCNTIIETQVINIYESPIPKITAALNPICNQATVSLTGLTGSPTTLPVVWDNGTNSSGFSNPNDLTTTYTPTAAERAAGVASIYFRVSTGLLGACAQVFDRIDITILPENTLNNPDNTKNICTGSSVDFSPSSVYANSFSWTATNADGLISNLTTTGTGAINQILTNTNASLSAIVIYTIIPHKDNCDGEPFTLTVNVTPKPVITSATPIQTTICSNSLSAIQLMANLPDTKYTWTSTTTIGAVTGHAGSTIPVEISVINDRLINTGTTQGTVIYKITPISATDCPGDEVTVTINVDPSVTDPTAGTDVSICNVTSYRLDGNLPKTNETGTWELTSGQVGVNFLNADSNSPNATATGLEPGESYTFRWTISAPGVCASKSASVIITVIPPTVAGTLDGARTICAGTDNGTINLTGNIGNVIHWESSIDGGTTWLEITNTTSTLNYNSLTQTTYYRAVVQNTGCTVESTNVTIITVTQPDTQANAGNPQTICGGTTVILDGNPADPNNQETGLWTVLPGAPPVHFDDATDPKTEVQNLIAGTSYTFVWTITGPSACGPSHSNVIIDVLPVIDQNTISSASTLVCSGQQITVIGSVPIGGNGVYQYLWEISTDAGATWTTAGGDTQNLDVNITVPTTFRRTVTSSTCTKISLEYYINALPPITNNTISANQAVCTNEVPAILTGTTPEGADGIFNYEWQFSTDGGTTWSTTGTFGADFQPALLARTTQYRRIVSTITCNGNQKNTSNVITVTVKPDAIAKFTYSDDVGCAPFQISTSNITAENHPNENATYTWFAGTTEIGTGITFPGHLISNSNENVVIKLVVTPKIGCNLAEFSWTFSTNQAVPASFTPINTTICGPQQVTFVNTSLQGAGATFKWNFGNQQSSTDANPQPVTFQPDPSGKDTTYTVTLYTITTCGIDSAKATVLVRSAPRPIFSPSTTNGCSPMPVTFTNNSPLQSGVKYYFNFGDGTSPQEVNDRSTVNHIYRTTTNQQTFNATLTAVSNCGTETTEPYVIVVKPNTVVAELVVNGNQLRGCAPFTVTFDNNSTGATDFTVDFKDGSQPRQSFIFPERFTHTFTTPGTYKVTLTATNGCSTNETTETIIVLPQPITDFEADHTLGCSGLTVKFKNNTQNGISYKWDFGDGSAVSTDVEPTHTYSGDQEFYTVTLTATNNLGCEMTVTKTNLIHIVQPPVAAFKVNPSTLISIPDYTFKFEDESTNNPTIWHWDFGDGITSESKNPSHTYLDTGTYKVTLKVTNQQGCFSTTFKEVTIKGVPGYLFVPNSFIPGSEIPELRLFSAKGSGIASWRFSIFNKWGQMLWESTKLEEGRPTEGWDGTFKGQPMPQGVYFWKIEVQMVNGSEWKGMTYDKSAPKRTGPIHLIR
jgi:PKD repeat protein